MRINILIKSILLLLIAISTISIWADDKNATSEKYFSLIGDADKAISEGNWLMAEQALQQAMRLEPGNPSNVLLMHFSSGQYPTFCSADNYSSIFILLHQFHTVP